MVSRRRVLVPDPVVSARLLAAAPPIEQRLPTVVGFYVLAYLQLALRHPGVRGGESERIVRAAALALGEAIVARVPELAGLVAAGWDDGEDV